jgi:hypothetical protein
MMMQILQLDMDPDTAYLPIPAPCVPTQQTFSGK